MQPEIKFGKRLRKLRLTHGHSQFEIEVAAQLSHGIISRIERGQVNPTKETLYKIAKILELNLSEIIYLFGFDTLATPKSRQLKLCL